MERIVCGFSLFAQQSICVNQDIRNLATVRMNKTFIVLNKYNKAAFIAILWFQIEIGSLLRYTAFSMVPYIK